MTADGSLQIDHISAGYGSKRVVIHDVSFDLPAAGSLVLVGSNGSGKSTLAKAIMGLATIEGGTILFSGARANGVGPVEMVRRGISYLPQRMRVFSDMSVRENIEIALHGGNATHRRGRLAELMDLFPILRTRQRDRASTLSGGQQQLVAIARGLISKPKLLILDEPTWGLSNENAAFVSEHLLAVRREEQAALLVIEHNVKWAAEVCPSFLALRDGRVVDQGDTAELLNDNGRSTRIFF